MTDIAALLAEAKRPERTVEIPLNGTMVPFRLRALLPRDFSKLLAEHPPRPDVEEDKGRSVNMDTFWLAVIAASITDPEMSAEQVQQLSEVVNWRVWDTLGGAAWAVNTGPVDVPFSPAASPTIPESDES